MSRIGLFVNVIFSRVELGDTRSPCPGRAWAFVGCLRVLNWALSDRLIQISAPPAPVPGLSLWKNAQIHHGTLLEYNTLQCRGVGTIFRVVDGRRRCSDAAVVEFFGAAFCASSGG